MEKLQKVFEVIECRGSFLVFEHKNSEPFFTNDIERASKYSPNPDEYDKNSIAENVIDIIETKGYTMPLTIKTLKVSYEIIDLV